MTTYTLTGIQVTTVDGGTAAVAASELEFITTDTLSMRFNMAASVADDFAAVTLATSNGTLYRTTLNDDRLALNGTAYLAQYNWGIGKSTTMLMIDTGEAGVVHYFAISGSSLPALADAEAYDAFMAGLTSISSSTFSPANIRPNSTFAIGTIINDTSVAADLLIGDPLHDDWSGTDIKTGAGADTVIGMDTVENMFLGIGNDYAEGQGGNDTLRGEGGNDELYGGAGTDTIIGGNGNDLIDGGTDADRLSGGDGIDTILGDDGNDWIDGGFGADYAAGGIGDDTINGGGGTDSILGEAGIDVLYGGAGADTINGGDGDDIVFGGGGDDSMIGGNGADKLNGGSGSDLITGGSGNDTINGGAFADALYGGSHNDRINGGTGADTIDGGSGNDTLNGNGGADTFVFDDNDGADVVVGFQDDIDTLFFDTDLGLTSVADAMAAAEQVGNNVVFTFAGGETVTVNGVTKAALANDIEVADFFLFA